MFMHIYIYDYPLKVSCRYTNCEHFALVESQTLCAHAFIYFGVTLKLTSIDKRDIYLVRHYFEIQYHFYE